MGIFTYDSHEQELTKEAWVYLPYGYSEDQKYNIMYISHGGWSNETTIMGTDTNPRSFKHVNLTGNLLAILAAAVWGGYCVITRKISSYGYDTIQTTRRIFGIGILSCLLEKKTMDCRRKRHSRESIIFEKETGS